MIVQRKREKESEVMQRPLNHVCFFVRETSGEASREGNEISEEAGN